MVPGQAGGPRKKAARARAQQRPSSPRDLLVSWHRVHGSPCLGALVVAGGALVAKPQICTLCDASESPPSLCTKVTALTQKRHSGPKCDGRVSDVQTFRRSDV